MMSVTVNFYKGLELASSNMHNEWMFRFVLFQFLSQTCMLFLFFNV